MANLWNRLWVPLCKAADLATPPPKTKTWKPHYGWHALRHAAASIWIEHGVKPLKLKKRMGHARIETTLNTYGHLFPDDDADERIALAAEAAVLNAEQK